MWDVTDAQVDNGRMPDFAPHPFNPKNHFSSSPGWGDVGVHVPWIMWLNFADASVADRCFDNMKRWIDWIHQNNPDHVWRHQRGNPFEYGDWLNYDTFELGELARGSYTMPLDAFSTAQWFESTQHFAALAKVLGKTQETEQYSGLAQTIAKTYQEQFIQSDGLIEGDCQASYALSIGLGLVDQAILPAAVERMVQKIHDLKGHLSTGFHATIHALNTLSRFGHHELACHLVMQHEFPSWGYMLDHGATTVWERWDGFREDKPEAPYQNPGMNSFCHYSFGSVVQWIVEQLAGIAPTTDGPGFEQVIIQPRPTAKLDHVDVTYQSLRGDIRSAWKRQGNQVQHQITVPGNTLAKVRLTDQDDWQTLSTGQHTLESTLA